MSVNEKYQLNNAKHIETDKHVLIPGMTGSGKSVLAETYLAGYEHVIKLDTKDEVTERRRDGLPLWRGLTEGKDYTVIDTLAAIDGVETPKIIYTPNFEEQTQEFYNAFFKYVYERENTIAWIDELMSVAESPNRYPPYLKACYTRGRSKNVALWALTQRPVDIPVICGANTTYFFVFDLNMDQDREKMYRITGQREMLSMPGEFNFWYYRVGERQPTKARLKFERG